tara:strand:+ start:1850 stop:3166 length:1317 start_codon:yes stop_codon:yes gene_type:complete
MSKESDFLENKAAIREILVHWFVNRMKFCDGQCYQITDKEKKIVRRVPTDECIHMIRLESRSICERPGFGKIYLLWANDIKQILEHATSVLKGRGDERIIAVGDTPLDGDYSNRPYAINRLPVDFGLPQTIADADRQVFLDTLMEQLPEFYHDLRSRMVSPEMWNILTCFFGRVVSEDTPSEEFVYWYGEGGDGKGSLTDLFFRNMPETSVPIAHENFESRFGAGVYGEKRFVRIDEVQPGNFFTERVKEVTGGAEFISLERKGKDAVTVKSRLAIMFTSNYSPAYDDSMAQRRRIRVVECTPRVSAARDVKSELEASFAAFLGYCLVNYELHFRKIPMNANTVLQALSEETNMRSDTWIINNIEYRPGEWMSSKEVSELFAATNHTPKLTYQKMMRRFDKVMQQQSTDGGVVMQRMRQNQRGWQNVRPKNESRWVKN